MTGDRVEREVVEQHRRLDALFSAVRERFVAGDETAELPASIGRLQDALEVHFLQEDQLYYPSICALRPEQRAELQAVIATHQHLRDRLVDLEGLTARADYAGASRAFEALAEDFRRHEVREEELLHALERDLGAGSGLEGGGP